MSARIIDGKAFAETLRGRVAQVAASFENKTGRRAGLAVVLVGDDPASHIYVRNKGKQTVECGMNSFEHLLPEATPEAELLALVESLNADPAVDGILVQLPLPAHVDATGLIQRIRPDKDVDGFHAENVGRLALRQPGLRPCTPKGIMTLLAHTDKPVRGRHAVIVGVSNHVGRPLLLEYLLAGATVTACHRFTPDLPEQVAKADLLTVAVGKPGLVKGEWVKPGAVVIDVGINRLADGTLTGDVEYASAADRASWITPVPGGVGPMTVAMLMQNTLEATEMRGE